MGRKAGSRNFENVKEEMRLVEVTKEEKAILPIIFTNFKKDIISIDDFMAMSGLSYAICAKIVREIKAVSDVLNIQGVVHKTDYFIYLSRRFYVQNDKNGEEK